MMFCRLYEFSIDTGLSIDTAEHKKDCRHSDGELCSMCATVERKLESDHYGWVIDRVLKFDEDDNILRNFEIAIRLIHPVHNIFWIVRTSKDEQTHYLMFFGQKKVGANSLERLNATIAELNSYDGREITEEDFVL